MQGRGRGDPFDFDPFAGFSAFGGIGGRQSLMSGLFGGRDPFDDPFFRQPFGGMFEPSVFGPSGSPFGPTGGPFGQIGSPFGPTGSPYAPSVSPFAGAPHSGFIEQQEPQPNKRRGPVIEELDSDDEKLEDGGPSKTKDNPRKHSRVNREPYIEIPDDEADGRSNSYLQRRNEFGNGMHNTQPQSGSQFYTFQSSSVSYGGNNGTYYTKSMTRRAGSDGVAFEELKEADSTTGQANHRISRALHDKGHTLSRKLESDGKVDTSQMLHNLNEDEIDGFEQAWEGSSGRHFTGSRQRLEGGNFAPGPGNSGQTSRGGWALPSTQHPEYPGSNDPPIASGNAAVHSQHTERRAGDHGHGSRGKRRA